MASYVRPDLSAVPAALRERADQGDVVAMREIADTFYQAKGVEKDIREAFLWYERAANGGDADSQGNVAHFIADGVLTGVRDLTKAHPWYLKAASQSESYSKHTLWRRQRERAFDQDLLLGTLRRQADALRDQLAAQHLIEDAANAPGLSCVCWRLLTWPISAFETKPAQLGTSRLGGVPDLPEGMRWPKVGRRPLVFVAQIALLEIATAKGIPALWAARSALPTRGMLWFFIDSPSGGGLRVLYANTQGLKRVTAPKGFQDVFPALRVVFEPELTLPPRFSWDPHAVLGAKFATHRLLDLNSQDPQNPNAVPLLDLSVDANNPRQWGDTARLRLFAPEQTKTTWNDLTEGHATSAPSKLCGDPCSPFPT